MAEGSAMEEDAVKRRVGERFGEQLDDGPDGRRAGELYEGDSGERRAPADAASLKASALKAARRARAAVTPDRLLAALCLAVALVMAAPWVRVSVAELVGLDVAYSVPDVLGTGQVLVDRAQSLEDLVEKARSVVDRAAEIVEGAQDAAKRAQDALDGRG